MRMIRNIGRYEVLREIGRGGMATVYLARQTDLDRMVALKELATFHAQDAEFAQRFLRESRLIGSLTHPNILTVFDYFEHEGTPYIAMEYVERGSLRPFMRSLDLAQIGGVMEGVLAALAHAEQHGIVHRDIKPENVMVTADGGVKLADFGIAKATSQMETGGFETATGITVGTPMYMAPEQAMAQDVGPWTDLYSVGCMAFEMLTGSVPFPDTDAPMAILLRHINEGIPPVKSVEPSVDHRVSDWVERLLKNDPRQRTASALEAWEELEEVLIAVLGPRWRRGARISGPAQAASVETPPTPAPFEESASDEFGSFAWGDPAAASPAEAPPHDAAVPSVVTPLPAPAPDDGFVTFGAPAPEPSYPPSAPPSPSAPPRPEARTPPLVSIPYGGGPFDAKLVNSFCFLHGPLAESEGGVPLLGNRAVVDSLKDRLLHSRGGTFLITGFRGVGKTTVVLRALEEVQAEAESSLEYLPVVLSVARTMTVDQLLFEVVRRLFEALMDRGVLDTLEPDTQQALLLAYARTSLAFKETSSRARETSQSLNLDLGRLGPAGPALAVLTPKIGVSRKRTDSMAREAAFLAYSQSDVEHDFLRIIDLLNNPVATSRRRRLGRRRYAPWRGRLVVVLDELDKLTSTPEGMRSVDALLMGLKNILTAPHVHFIFVGGPELHDAFMRDASRGNSVYESVFAHHMYVPCVWNASRELLGAVLDQSNKPAGSSDLTHLEWYFDFKSRGIPRLLLRELNGLVRWRDGRAVIEVGELDATRLAFYAHVQSIVDDFVATGVDKELLALPIDHDRWRLGAYYITDWVLRRGNAAFTVSDILSDEATPNPLIKASNQRVELLVEHLCRHNIIEELWAPEPTRTVVADAEQVTVYRLAADVVAKLASFARNNELERAGLRRAVSVRGQSTGGLPAPAATPWMTNAGLGTLDQGRYEIGELVGVGGLGRVYRAVDRRLHREVAIKVPGPYLLRDEYARGRWRREAEIAARLKHPNIVNTYDVFEHDDGSMGIVMQLIEGPSLRAVLPLAPLSAVAVAVRLLDALAYGRDAGLARFDIKPENVLFEHGSRPVIVDVGLVKPVRTGSGAFATMLVGGGTRQAVVGTPAYMSPEQALGMPVDIRSDLFTVALVLYEAIGGTPLRDLNSSPDNVLREARSAPEQLGDLDASAALHEVLKRALALDPDERFPSPEAMQDALLATPEGDASTRLDENALLIPMSRPEGAGHVGEISRPVT